MSDVLELLSVFQVSIDGAPLNDAKREALLDAVVEQSSELPDAATLRFGISLFQEGGEDLLTLSAFPEGAEVKIETRNLDSATSTLFEGEIVGVEMDLTSIGPSTLTVRALHPAHRLMRGSRQLTFLQQSDGDIFKKVVTAVSLTARNNAVGGNVYPYTIQDNLSDWEFLQLIARRRGARVGCGSGKEVVLDAFGGQATTAKVKWGEDLLNFRPRTHGAGQVDKVIVRGWDPKTKALVTATATDLSMGVPSAGTNVTKGKKGLPASEYVLTNQAVVSQAEAQALADSTLRRLRGRYLQMEALCTGDAKYKPGVDLEVSNVGERFNGSYPITSAVHTYSPGEGYSTQVFSTGRDAEGLLPALGNGAAEAPHGSGMGLGSFAIAIVTNNNDAEKLGRVKVKFPALNDAQESFWCRLVSPMAGAGRGFLFIPEINDEVLVAFEQGSPHLPYVIGVLWNGKDTIPDDMSKAVVGGKVERRTIKTRVGHTITFDDSDGARSVKVVTKDGHYLLLDDINNLLNLKDKSGSNNVLIDSAGGNIEINAKTNITMKAATGKITLEAAGAINVHSKSGNVKTTADAGRIDTDAKMGSTFKVIAAKVDLTPASAEVNSPTSSVKGSALVIVQGALVKIN